ncbi:serine/threonine-protein kinase [Streptomyces sp. NPDC002688]|uniref:serine/threonine-protein kinase n=1 Tax=Streptomyces sp. NPDC002688 TaxID=3154423 RepID=UPI00331A8FCA
MQELKPSDPRLVGRYRISARLGAGGMGRVYLGRSPSGRLVAVKVVRPEMAEDPGFRLRFAREVAAARKVTGFFTAALVDADADGSPPWLATAYVPGMPLDAAVAAHGSWPVNSVRALGAGLAEALEAIHAAGLIHRDLKPSNVLIAPDGPRVVDFGISVATEATALTRAGTIVGTPGFMAPEQLTGEPVTPATDVFALGAVLTYAATGTGPFGTGSAQSLNFRIAYEEPRLGGLPSPGLELVARCLSKDPAQRPQVAELIEELALVAGISGYTPTEIVAEPVAWLPEQVAAALPATVTAPPSPGTTPPPPEPVAAAPVSAPAAPTRPARSVPKVSKPVPVRPTAVPVPARSTAAVGAPRTTGNLPAARAVPALKTPSSTFRRALLFWISLVALALAVYLPFTPQASLLDYLTGGYSFFVGTWSFTRAWPFAAAIALSWCTCAAVLSALRRSPAASVPRPIRYLHLLTTALTAGLFVTFALVDMINGLGFPRLALGGWLFALGCVALIRSTFRLAGPKQPPVT